MNWTSLGAQLAQIGLPALGTILGGPLGGTIGSVLGRSIAGALGTEPTPEAISAVVQADPETARVRLAEIEAQNQDAAEETKRLQARLADVQDARHQTVALAQTGSSATWGAPLMSAASFACFLAFTIALFFIQSEIPDKLYTLINAGYGAILIWVGQSMNYWLGSSDGSRRSGDVLRAVAANANSPSAAQIADKALDANPRRAAGR